MIDKTEIGKRYLALRKSLGLSQDAFAKPLEVHRVTISQVEKGIITPSLDMVIKTVSHYNVSFESILTGEEGEDVQFIELEEKIKYLQDTVDALKTSNKDKERLVIHYKELIDQLKANKM